MESLEMIRSCPLCDSTSQRSIFSIKTVPKSAQKIYKSQKDAVKCEVGSLELVICQKCSLIFNEYCFKAVKKQNQDNKDNYYYSVSFSPSSKDYQRNLVGRISGYLDLENKNALEIGSGDGFFLNELSRYCNKAIGFEPSRTYALSKPYKNERLRFFNKFFYPGKTILDERIDIFILRHVLEHMCNPLLFLKMLNKLHNSTENTQHLFIEVPNTAFLLKNKMYFDFYYDHIFYFSDISLFKLLRSAGWGNIDWCGNKDSEFLTVLCSNKGRVDTEENNAFDSECVDNYLKAVNSFAKKYCTWRAELLQLLLRLISCNKKIAAWGAGSRGVTLINNLFCENVSLNYIIDADKNKNAHYIPLSGMQIFTPDKIEKKKVDYMLITAFTYFNEIQSFLERYRKDGLMIIKTYPNIEIS